jgi:hypothetical protein
MAKVHAIGANIARDYRVPVHEKASANGTSSDSQTPGEKTQTDRCPALVAQLYAKGSGRKRVGDHVNSPHCVVVGECRIGYQDESRCYRRADDPLSMPH